jgi:excisionase family DNA binding protein
MSDTRSFLAPSEDIANADALQSLTVPEASAAMRCHPNTTRTLIRSGRLPGCYRIGHYWRIPASAIRKFMADAAGGAK